MRHIYFSVLIFATACGTIKDTPSSSNNKEDTPTIVFLNYTIAKAQKKSVSIRFVNEIYAEGELKKRGVITPVLAEDDLKCIQVSSSLERLDSLIVPNPLVRNIEYVDSVGALGIKRIELDNAEFSVRMQLHPHTKYVLIEKADKVGNQLLKTKL